MINLNLPFNNMTGYGIVSTNIWKEIRKLTKVGIFPIAGVSFDSDLELKWINNDFQNNWMPEAKNSACLKIWHINELFNRIGSGRYGVFPFFEIDKINPLDALSLNYADVIFTSCEWARQILIENGIKESSIVIASPGIDHSIFDYTKYKKPERNDNYIFINIGKWQKRKGHDILVNAFNHAFSEKDNVELWMINDNPFLTTQETQQWHNLYKRSKLGEKIKIINRLSTHRDLAQKILEADCGIYPARAEGWNNEIPETMAMNKPVIATNYSAHTAYCTKENSFLIDIKETEPAKDGSSFDGSGNWAKLAQDQIDQMISHMRYVYNNRISSNEQGVQTCKSLKWSNTAFTIKKHLQK
jgi:glycosyltransferase involved in cell wall biosynthesis